MTGALAMGANKITGLANGSAASDAAAFGQIPTVTRGSMWTFKAGVPTSGAPVALAGDICVNNLTNDLYSTADGTTWVKQFTIAGDVIPIGLIAKWSGSIATIPAGWGLCDGGVHDGQTTPDLRNKFIVGADADVSGVAKSTVRGAAAQTGGEATHRLQVGEIGVDAHTHNGVYAGYSAAVGTSLANMVLGTTSTYINDGSQMAGRIGPTTPVQAANAHENTPPWYALAYIMRTVQTAPSSAAIPNATDSVAGLMSAADKTKLDTAVGALRNPICIVAGSTIMTLASAAWVAMTWASPNELEDQSAMYSASHTSRITIPAGADGIYLIIGCIRFDPTSTAGSRYVRIYKNGTTALAYQMSSAAGVVAGGAVNISVEAPLVATDYIELSGYQDSGVTLTTVVLNPAYPRLSVDFRRPTT